MNRTEPATNSGVSDNTQIEQKKRATLWEGCSFSVAMRSAFPSPPYLGLPKHLDSCKRNEEALTPKQEAVIYLRSDPAALSALREYSETHPLLSQNYILLGLIAELIYERLPNQRGAFDSELNSLFKKQYGNQHANRKPGKGNMTIRLSRKMKEVLWEATQSERPRMSISRILNERIKSHLGVGQSLEE